MIDFEEYNKNKKSASSDVSHETNYEISQINSISLGEYSSYDRSIIFNDNDPDLVPIVYNLPSPPPLETIDGFGLAKEEQYFRRTKIPSKLVALNKEPLTSNQKIIALESNPDYYADEIAFIEREWKRAEQGYWFFNFGRPTYITNYHYLFLTYWHMQNPDSPLGFFCMYDREAYLFIKMVCEDPFCLGMNWPKHRRAGATSIVSELRYFRSITNRLHHSALQSMTDDSAKRIHLNHMIYGWDRMVFWFKPVDNNNTKNTSEISFYSPRFKTNPDYGVDSIESRISYGPCTETYYDGDVVNTMHNDEEGKSIECNVYERGRIQKPTMMRGTRIVGKSFNTSTVEEMDKKGGAAFKKKCDGSQYHKKDPITKMTTTGLYTLFIPAYEKMDGDNPLTGEPWIAKYGFHDPYAEDYIHAQAKQYEAEGNTQARNDHYRLYPCVYRDCWRPAAKNSPFNLTIVNNRLDKLETYTTPLKKIGDFEWVPGCVGAKAFFRLNPDGAFQLSWDFDTPEKANARNYDPLTELYSPANTRLFIAGADPFGFRLTAGTRKSKAAFAIKYKIDTAVDNIHNTPPELWQSDRIICTYLKRTDTPEEACVDWMMACCYFGCQVYPENNINVVNNVFLDNGYAKYLYFDIKDNGKYEVNPGDKTDQYVKELIFARTQSYVKNCAVRCCHDEYLKEVRDISDPDEMTKFDLFTAAGYAFLGEYKDIGSAMPEFNSKKPVDNSGSLDDVLIDYDLDEFYQ